MLLHVQIDLLSCRRLATVLCLLLGLVSVTRPARAAVQEVPLGTWSEFDPKFFGAGVQELSANTATGFTSTHSGSVTDFPERPRVYQEFDALDVSQVGQKLTATFDLQFHEMPPISDTGFRFGFGDRSTNQGLVPMMIDTQAVSGSTFRARYDDSLTDNASVFATDDYSGFLSASGTYLSGGTSPTGPGGGVTDTVAIHSFIVTIERVERNVDTSFPADGIADEVVGGWYTTITWDSDQAGAEPVFRDVNNADFASFDVDTGLGVYPEDIFNVNGRINNIDTLGFMIYLDDPFSTTSSMGSYSISNFVLEYDDATLAADFDEDVDVDADDLLIWETNHGLSGSATKMLGDTDADMDVDGSDFLTWQKEFTGPLTAIAASQAVPEPSSLLLAAMGAMAFAARQCRRHC